MRHRKLATAFALTAILALSTISSNAGSSSFTFQRLQGVTIAGKMSGGSFFIFLQRGEGAVGDFAEMHALPTPTQPEAALYVDRGPVQNTTSIVPFLGSSFLQGCIAVVTSKGVDAGCGPLKASTLNLDPAGQSGTVNLSVYSKNWEPRQLVANLVLTGTNSITPSNGLNPVIVPAPPATGPYHVTITASELLTRGMKVQGQVYSEHLASLTVSRTSGGGAVKSTSVAQFFDGLFGKADVRTEKIVCPPSGAASAVCAP